MALTGAGISTESGIPDFRGPQGVWTRNPAAEKLSHIRPYMEDAEVRKEAWKDPLDYPAWTATPNDGHRALAELERRGKLQAVITQNIDGLQQRAGCSGDRVIEVHGTVHDAICMRCAWRGPMAPVLERVRAGESDPAVPCVWRDPEERHDLPGQALVPAVIERAMEAAERADLLLAVGTSLQVYPIAGAVPAAKAACALVVILNAEPTPFDDIAHAVLRGRIGDVLPRIVRER